MVDALATTIIVTSLLMAVWAMVSAGLNRPPDLAHLAGLAVVEVIVLVQAVVAVSKLVAGDRPAATATFLGYLVAAVAVLPLGAWLALMERTRWGSVLIGSAALVLPVLVLRLGQIWNG